MKDQPKPHCQGRFIPSTAWAGLMGLILTCTHATGEIRWAIEERDITPPLTLTNWITGKAYSGRLDSIHAKSVYLTDDKTEAVILSLDLLDTFENSVARIRQSVEAATGIPGKHVLINASHTHSAPWSARLGAPFLSSMRSRVADCERSEIYQTWFGHLIDQISQSVLEARKKAVPVELSVARCQVGDWLFNRRPRTPQGLVETVFQPQTPHVLPGGMRFGPVDPVALILVAEARGLGILSASFNLACHPVSIYPFHDGVSGDWPGATSILLAEKLGAPVQFLQGCGGNIVPTQRGIQSRDQMAAFVSERCYKAIQESHSVHAKSIRIEAVTVPLPLTQAAAHDWEADVVFAEVMGLSLGDLVIVTLPGEPLIELALDIQARSPFPHTMVLGYSNGHGVHYVGRSGQKSLGGYEMGPAGAGEDACGDILTKAAIELIHRIKE